MPEKLKIFKVKYAAQLKSIKRTRKTKMHESYNSWKLLLLYNSGTGQVF